MEMGQIEEREEGRQVMGKILKSSALNVVNLRCIFEIP